MASRNNCTNNQAPGPCPFRFLSTFMRDESGTSLTELVITLPVFIIIWVGMLNLSQLERKSVRVKLEASSDTWHQAMEVADGGLVAPVEVGVPALAGLNAMGDISQYPSGNADYMAQLTNIGLMSGGTSGEAKRATTVLGLLGQSPSGSVPGESLSAYPRDMLDDSRYNPITSASGPLAAYFMVIPLSFLGANQTPAAGMRYGSVTGYSKETFTVAGRDFTFEASYDVLNSPVDKPDFIEDLMVVPGFSRLMAADDPCLSNILELSTDMGYTSNCF